MVIFYIMWKGLRLMFRVGAPDPAPLFIRSWRIRRPPDLLLALLLICALFVYTGRLYVNLLVIND
jgi:hypothetical protein